MVILWKGPLRDAAGRLHEKARERVPMEREKAEARARVTRETPS
jgi:hypothetical protein